jgi:hypothetical protein
MLHAHFNHCVSLLCRANNLRALLLCRAPISTAHSFWFLHYYLLRTVFVSHADIPHTFHSTRCTMPKFSTPPPRTNTLRAPLTKLSRDNIYPHCARTNQTPLRSANTAHTTHTIIMCVHTAHLIMCTHTHIMCMHTAQC